jgi:LytS/YehU family sensor histidine kinase
MLAGPVFGQPYETALAIVRSAAVPMLVSNAAGMAVFVTILAVHSLGRGLGGVPLDAVAGFGI